MDAELRMLRVSQAEAFNAGAFQRIWPPSAEGGAKLPPEQTTPEVTASQATESAAADEFATLPETRAPEGLHACWAMTLP